MGATSTTTLQAATAITAPVTWDADATSNATFTGIGGHYKGASQLASGGQLTLNLDSDALWEVPAPSSLSLLNLQGDATLDASLLPVLKVPGNLTNAGGLITLVRSDPSPGNVLDLQGVYTANGGTLAINTVLNNAASSITDQLSVSSTVMAGAPTLVSVLPDPASVPDYTAGKGILVVKITGGAASSAAGAFALANGYIDRGGFRYTLVRDASDGNWYLQSEALGTLVISKTIDAPAGTPLVTAPFSVNVACTGPAYNATVQVVASQQTSMQLPSASACVVTEDSSLPSPPANYAWDISGDYPQYVVAPTGPIPAGGTQTVSITNKLLRQMAAINISTTVMGGPASGFSGEFTYAIQCGADGSYTASVMFNNTGSGTQAVSGIPLGASCTVTQTTPSSPSGYAWDAAPPAVTVQALATGSTASFNNSLTQSTATVAGAVPTLGEWALMLLSAAMAGFGVVRLRRSRVH